MFEDEPNPADFYTRPENESLQTLVAVARLREIVARLRGIVAIGAYRSIQHIECRPELNLMRWRGTLCRFS